MFEKCKTFEYVKIFEFLNEKGVKNVFLKRFPDFCQYLNLKDF